MKFPIIILKTNEAPIYYFNESEFGLISKGGENFYKKGAIYDIEGNVYLIEGIESIQKAPFLKSLKYFQQMYKVKIKLKLQKSSELSEFKTIIVSHFNKFERYWVNKDLIFNLESKVNEMTSFLDLINLLK